MERVPEPELMLDPAQALAYARADFEEAHGRIVDAFFERFPQLPAEGRLIDLGCGPGDITLRLARRLPGWQVTGIDGSPAMLALAREASAADAAVAGRVCFLERHIPESIAALGPGDAVFSNSLLHHLPDPMALWKGLRHWVRPGAAVFVADLFRPRSPQEVASLVHRYAAHEPEVLRRDFAHSLRAAFTPTEVRRQLEQVALAELLQVETISDRHLVVWGRMA